MSWFSPTRWLVLGVSIVGLVLAALWLDTARQQIGYDRATAEWVVKVDRQKAESQRVLDIETAKSDAVTQALNDFKISQELQDAKNQTTVADLQGRLRAAAGAAGRLRDPNAAGCGGGGTGAQGADPTGTGDRAGDNAEAGGLLSRELTEFLLSQTASADKINIAYASCRADAIHIRDALK
ncbi:hypothetical protein [Polaromonas sp. CG_23.6]|uniref:hypothetical protein n=1 Tax=Polaromonas sp. CG_23.6 TaxID=2760709 RepID=UPI0024742414|nr:hypothetical protein [Polaromonas sp. CG_23.6]MDH6185470.1 hypothetical protein [Polaromonas sp. CG_23.6]